MDTTELPATLQAVLARVGARVGEPDRQVLGVAGVELFRRYAVATGDDAYLADSEAALREGREVIAPPLFVANVTSWDGTPVEAALRADGLAATESPGTAGLDVAQVHGGQRIELGEPLVAGTTVEVARTLLGAEPKRGRSGVFVRLHQRADLTADVGGQRRLLARVEETIIVRDGGGA